MLIESTTVNSAGSQGSAADSETIQKLQSELEQFIAATAARLDALSVALCEAESSSQCEAESNAEPQPASHPRELESQAERTERTHQPGEPIEIPAMAIDSPPISTTASSVMEPDPIQPMSSEPSASQQEPVDPDEAWARLSAIKSRIAKQLENQ